MTDDVKKDEVRKRSPFFATPVGYVSVALLLWVLACVLAAGALVVLRNVAFADAETRIILTYFAFGPSTLLLVASVAFMIVGSIRWALFGQDAVPSARLNHAREIALLESINHRLLLSETAKKVNYRIEDMTMLRQTIREDIRKGEFNAAMVLVTELANTYGQLEESEAFRTEIEDARTKDQEARIQTGIASLERHVTDHDFAAANKEAARLQRIFPMSADVAELPRRVAVAKEQHKKELERAFLQASERDEVDRALEIMGVLDKMLSPEEAAPFREVARDVIGKKRDNLGVQFKLAVHDREWVQAVSAGEQIIKQFPNTRMADEVRERIDQLRANAAGNDRGVLTNNATAPITPVTPTTPPIPTNPVASRPGQPAGKTGISYTVVE